MHAGKWTGLNNAGLNASNSTFKMHFLDTQYPIIQKFFYQWMLRVMTTSYPSIPGTIYQWPYPRLNFAVYYYRPQQINDLTVSRIDPETKKIIELPTSQQDPSFIYYLTGCFPIKVSVPGTDHNKSGTDVSRAVDFAFNNFYLFPNKEIAKLYGYQFLFPSVEVLDAMGGRASYQTYLKVSKE